MAKIRAHVSIDIDATAASVWKVLGGFDGLPAFSSAISVSQLEEQGRLRVLTNRNGGILWERLLHFDENRRTLSYEIIDTKACGALEYGVGYRGKVRVLSRRGGRAATFDYQADFQPSRGVSAKDARAAIEAFAADCAAGIRRILSRR